LTPFVEIYFFSKINLIKYINNMLN